MLATTVLQIFGLFAIGALIALMVTPLIFRTAEIVIYVLALIVVLLRAMITSQLPPKKVFEAFHKLLNGFPKYMNSPIHKSDSTKDNVCFPNAIDNAYGTIVSQVITPQKPTNGSSYADNHNGYGFVKQPTIKKLFNSTCNICHRIILFYRSYYGHSTKVEKNLCTRRLVPGSRH
jgi:hypothetical protein